MCAYCDGICGEGSVNFVGGEGPPYPYATLLMRAAGGGRDKLPFEEFAGELNMESSSSIAPVTEPGSLSNA